MNPLIVIVADDLTGAADCGVACTAAGLDTVVILGEAAAADALAAEAVAFDADTRSRRPEAAVAATARAVRRLCGSGKVRVLYKKIDSTLRGHFAAEIGAARQAHAELSLGRGAAGAAPWLAVVAPAFPATGRTVRGGRMFVRGVPLEETEVWRHAEIPGVADVPALLQAHAGLSACAIPLETIRAGEKKVAAALAHHSARGVHAVVCDAEIEDDLWVVAQAAARLNPVPTFAGSAGLARHLPAAFGLSQGRGSAETSARPRSDQGGGTRVRPDRHLPAEAAGDRAQLLFVVGSRSEVSYGQVAYLAREHGVAVVTVPSEALRRGPGGAEWQASSRRAQETLHSGEDVAVVIGPTEGVHPAEGAALSKALAQFSIPLTSQAAGLFCSGGETARAVLNAAGLLGIRLVGEVEPGVPLGRGEGRLAGLPIITKAGAFGDAKTLARCRTALRTLCSAAPSTSYPNAPR
ncbi:MAG TPA: four-carbon acid sugar kinase family protein [Chthoniobacterales bacterium]